LLRFFATGYNLFRRLQRQGNYKSIPQQAFLLDEKFCSFNPQEKNNYLLPVRKCQYLCLQIKIKADNME